MLLSPSPSVCLLYLKTKKSLETEQVFSTDAMHIISMHRGADGHILVHKYVAMLALHMQGRRSATNEVYAYRKT
jgi:hypothetical protein